MREVRLWVSVTAAAVIFAVGAIGASTRTARAAQAVDVALVLAADVSRSINDDEFALQRRGYAAAIAIRGSRAIGSGPHRRHRRQLCRMGGRRANRRRWSAGRSIHDAGRRPPIRRHADGGAAILCGAHGDRLGDRFLDGPAGRERLRRRTPGDRHFRRRHQQPGRPATRGARRGGRRRRDDQRPRHLQQDRRRTRAAIWRCTPIRPAASPNTIATM